MVMVTCMTTPYQLLTVLAQAEEGLATLWPTNLSLPAYTGLIDAGQSLSGALSVEPTHDSSLPGLWMPTSLSQVLCQLNQ